MVCIYICLYIYVNSSLWCGPQRAKDRISLSGSLDQDEPLMTDSVFLHKDGGRVIDGEKYSRLPDCTEPLNKVAREMGSMIQ